jgi:hypothetical protein
MSKRGERLEQLRRSGMLAFAAGGWRQQQSMPASMSGLFIQQNKQRPGRGAAKEKGAAQTYS